MHHDALQVDANLSLGVAMLFMGTAIDLSDVSEVLQALILQHKANGAAQRKTRHHLLAFAAGLLVFPFAVLVVVHALADTGAPKELLLGLVILGACPVGKSQLLHTYGHIVYDNNTLVVCQQ